MSECRLPALAGTRGHTLERTSSEPEPSTAGLASVTLATLMALGAIEVPRTGAGSLPR
jgi:hypothetical protein